MNNLLEREAALEAYFSKLNTIPPPAPGSCYALARYTTKVMEIIETLYDSGYNNGFKDAINTDFEVK